MSDDEITGWIVGVTLLLSGSLFAAAIRAGFPPPPRAARSRRFGVWPPAQRAAARVVDPRARWVLVGASGVALALALTLSGWAWSPW